MNSVTKAPSLWNIWIAIVHAIADIHQTVARDAHAVHGVAVLLGRRRGGIVWAQVCVVGGLAVRAPMTFVLSGGGVEYNDASVLVAVCDIELVGACIGHGHGWPAETGRRYCCPGAPGVADLQQELAIARELEHLMVGDLAVARQPYVACGSIEMPCSLLASRSRPRPAPAPEADCRPVEFQNRRSRQAAFGAGGTSTAPRSSSVKVRGRWYTQI